jgi:lipopolysaccharide transport system ATP-binding protein
MANSAIQVRGLGKSYTIGAYQGRYKSLRDSLTSALLAPLRRLGRGASAELTERTIWALKDVSFDIQHGEVVGIIGRNGAGKSTLLKLLARITEPSAGEIRMRGRVGSLLEVGTGFHPELSGRENIFLNGAILGMSRAEIGRKFDEIVDFAEIEKFIDTPAKHYSSGMYMRLAFAVAAHLEPEILLVDEVLAVGDAQFQKKCLGKMGQVAQEGRTVLFVSHNMTAVQALCGRSLLFENGQLLVDGPSQNVISHYYEAKKKFSNQTEWVDEDHAPGNNSAKLRKVCLTYPNHEPIVDLFTSQAFNISVDYAVKKDQAKVGVTLILNNQEGVCVFSSINNQDNWHGIAKPAGQYQSICGIPANLLSDGTYSVTILLWEENYMLVCREEDVLNLNIVDSGEVRGDYLGGWAGVIRPLLHWSTVEVDQKS